MAKKYLLLTKEEVKPYQKGTWVLFHKLENYRKYERNARAKKSFSGDVLPFGVTNYIEHDKPIVEVHQLTDKKAEKEAKRETEAQAKAEAEAKKEAEAKVKAELEAKVKLEAEAEAEKVRLMAIQEAEVEKVRLEAEAEAQAKLKAEAKSETP